jgi:hypothetical protein
MDIILTGWIAWFFLHNFFLDFNGLIDFFINPLGFKLISIRSIHFAALSNGDASIVKMKAQI